MKPITENQISLARDRLEQADNGHKYTQIGNIIIALGHIINAIESVALDANDRLNALERIARGEDTQ